MLILIADDNNDMRAMLRSALAGCDCDFREAADGDEAVEMYDRELPDAVLMDVRMPRMDGLRATAAIRARHPGARIIVITAYDSPSLRAHAFNAGAEHYFDKNDLGDLPRCVCGSVRGDRGAR